MEWGLRDEVIPLTYVPSPSETVELESWWQGCRVCYFEKFFICDLILPIFPIINRRFPVSKTLSPLSWGWQVGQLYAHIKGYWGHMPHKLSLYSTKDKCVLGQTCFCSRAVLVFLLVTHGGTHGVTPGVIHWVTPGVTVTHEVIHEKQETQLLNRLTNSSIVLSLLLYYSESSTAHFELVVVSPWALVVPMNTTLVNNFILIIILLQERPLNGESMTTYIGRTTQGCSWGAPLPPSTIPQGLRSLL